MTLKKTIILIALMAVFAVAFGFQDSSDPKVLFEKAKFTMETKGDLKGAIKLFEKIIQKYPDEREYAAKSQLYIGLCYEKQGKEEAQKAYERVIQEYGDQQEVVAEARDRLALLKKPVGPPEAEGMVARQIWAGSGVDVEASPSPDGRYLSYVDWSTGDLALRDLKTGENRRLTDKGSWSESSEFALFPEMSPDGEQVAYAWYNEDFFFDLRIIGLDGSKPRVLYRNEEVEYVQPAEWSPDGEQILATFRRNDRTNQIAMISVADGSVRTLKTLDWRSPWEMRFSPDGRYIVYDFPQEDDSPQRDIFLLATDGSREIPLVEHPDNDLLLDWTPDGKRILFASDRTGRLGAWVADVSDGEAQGSPVLVKAEIGPLATSMGFTADGSFYYGLQTGMKDVFTATIDLETGELLESPARVTQRFVGSNSSPDWSLDGRYLAYVSKRDLLPVTLTRRILCIRSLESGEEREISPELDYFRNPRLSPDGRSIVVTGLNKKNRWGSYLIDAEKGNVTPVVLGEYVHYPAWSPDGKAIFYMRWDWEEKLSRIFVHDVGSGLDKELYRRVHSSWIENLVLSPDGRLLAFSVSLGDQESSSAALMVMSAKGGEPRELLRVQAPPSIALIAWTPDGQGVLFTRTSEANTGLEEEVELWRSSLKGGEPEKLEFSMTGRSQLCVHPDGQRIAFTAGEGGVEVWVMENFLPESEAEGE